MYVYFFNPPPHLFRFYFFLLQIQLHSYIVTVISILFVFYLYFLVKYVYVVSTVNVRSCSVNEYKLLYIHKLTNIDHQQNYYNSGSEPQGLTLVWREDCSTRDWTFTSVKVRSHRPICIKNLRFFDFKLRPSSVLSM